nr:unnamed protein product [Callosobruchus chinensis]
MLYITSSVSCKVPIPLWAVSSSLIHITSQENRETL